MKKPYNRKKPIETTGDINAVDLEYWVSDQVLKETEELIKDLENDPDLDKFEPTDELFERIVKEACERGLLTEDDAEDENKEDD